MTNRLLTAASALVILVVMAYFASSTFSQSGRNRDARSAQRDETPTLSTDDVRTAPVAQAPVGHAPSPGTVAHAAGPISWSSSFDDARRAASADQVIFVDVYTDWCGWCKYMDERVYTDASVQKFAANNVFVKLDAEDGREGTEFARRMQVRGYPTLLVFSKDGKLLASQPGAFRRPNDFLSWLEQTSTNR